MARSDFFIGMFVFCWMRRELSLKCFGITEEISIWAACSVSRKRSIDSWLLGETVHPQKSLTKLSPARRSAHGNDLFERGPNGGSASKFRVSGL